MFSDRLRSAWDVWIQTFQKTEQRNNKNMAEELTRSIKCLPGTNKNNLIQLKVNIFFDPTSACLTLGSWSVVPLNKCGFQMALDLMWVGRKLNVGVFVHHAGSYSLTCLRHGTEFLMQVPVRMSTLSTMTKGFSSRVTIERWFSSASSSP